MKYSCNEYDEYGSECVGISPGTQYLKVVGWMEPAEVLSDDVFYGRAIMKIPRQAGFHGFTTCSMGLENNWKQTGFVGFSSQDAIWNMETMG